MTVHSAQRSSLFPPSLFLSVFPYLSQPLPPVWSLMLLKNKCFSQLSLPCDLLAVFNCRAASFIVTWSGAESWQNGIPVQVPLCVSAYSEPSKKLVKEWKTCVRNVCLNAFPILTGCVCVCEFVCVMFVALLNGFFLDLMEQVPSQGNGLYYTYTVKSFETGEKLRALLWSICVRKNICVCDMALWIMYIFFLWMQASFALPW